MTFQKKCNVGVRLLSYPHPDAGKTTLTEKLLLYGGAIHLAGQLNLVKQQNTPYLTGWKSKTTWYLRNEFQYWNSTTMAVVSTSSIPWSPRLL